MMPRYSCVLIWSSQVALDLEHRQVSLSTHNDGPNQVVAHPHPVVTFLADQLAADFPKKPLESSVVDGTEGWHRLNGDGKLYGHALLADHPRRTPPLTDFLPAVLPQHFLPGALLGDLLNEEP